MVQRREDPFISLADRIEQTKNRPSIAAYSPHEKQKTFHSMPNRGRLFIGGNRSGKTVGGITEDIYWLRGNHPYRKVPEPPIMGRICTVDFLNGFQKIIKPELQRWIPPSLLINGSWEDSFDNLTKVLTLTNRSTVEVMSYDQILEKFAGTSRDFIHYDEEPPKAIYNECSARLVDRNGEWWCTMTPLFGMNWLFDDIYEPFQGMGDIDPSTGKTPRVGVLEVEMDQNPHLSPEAIEDYMSTLDIEQREARRKGKFVAHGGLIYPEFKPEIHVIPMVNPSRFKNELWVGGLDSGYTNATVYLWASVSPTGRIIIFDEYYQTQDTIPNHVRAINQKSLTHGRAVDFQVCDPSMMGITVGTGTSIHYEYSKRGIIFRPANNEVQAGILRVKNYLKIRPTPLVDKDGNSQNLPNIFITENCTNTIREFKRYRWGKFQSMKLNESQNLKETPHKKDDHCMDALRYILMSRPQLFQEVESEKITYPDHSIASGATSIDYDSNFIRQGKTPDGEVKLVKQTLNYSLGSSSDTEWTSLAEEWE